MANKAKELVAAGRVPFGAMLNIPSPGLLEIVAQCGYDFVVLDMEHGSFGPDTLEHLVRVCRVFGLTPKARVPDHNPKLILKALDVGCVGIMVPQVETEEEAARLAACLRYPPEATGASPMLPPPGTGQR